MSDEKQECEDFVAWAQGKNKREVNRRIVELVKSNRYAAELFAATREEFDSGAEAGMIDRTHQDGLADPILTNHTGYSQPGSHNWEHDDTGSQMNYSGMADIMLNAMAESEGWSADYDYNRADDPKQLPD